MESIADLMGKRSPEKKKATTQRGELIGYFVDQKFTDRMGKELSAAAVATRMAHYTLSQLYAVKSAYKDRLERNGREAARRWWWWSTKTTKV